MISVGKGFVYNFKGLLVRYLFLVNKNSKHLNNGDARVSVIQLHCTFVREFAPVSLFFFKSSNNIL